MIAIGCDHGGLDIKNAVIEYLKKNGIEYKDYGCYTSESVDYPKYAYKVATAVANKEAELGILCCGTNPFAESKGICFTNHYYYQDTGHKGTCISNGISQSDCISGREKAVWRQIKIK